MLPVLKKDDVKKASFFGSIARGELEKDSDIDILVELADELSLFVFIGLKNEFENTTERKVDLVEYVNYQKTSKRKNPGGASPNPIIP